MPPYLNQVGISLNSNTGSVLYFQGSHISGDMKFHVLKSNEIPGPIWLRINLCVDNVDDKDVNNVFFIQAFSHFLSKLHAFSRPEKLIDKIPCFPGRVRTLILTYVALFLIAFLEKYYTAYPNMFLCFINCAVKLITLCTLCNISNTCNFKFLLILVLCEIPLTC